MQGPSVSIFALLIGYIREQWGNIYRDIYCKNILILLRQNEGKREKKRKERLMSEVLRARAQDVFLISDEPAKPWQIRHWAAVNQEKDARHDNALVRARENSTTKLLVRTKRATKSRPVRPRATREEARSPSNFIPTCSGRKIRCLYHADES